LQAKNFFTRVTEHRRKIVFLDQKIKIFLIKVEGKRIEIVVTKFRARILVGELNKAKKMRKNAAEGREKIGFLTLEV
jgi:hypothetical protein